MSLNHWTLMFHLGTPILLLFVLHKLSFCLNIGKKSTKFHISFVGGNGHQVSWPWIYFIKITFLVRMAIIPYCNVSYLYRLLDVLAGRKDPAGLSGTLLLDGCPPPENFKCMVGYVVQVCGSPCLLLFLFVVYINME